MVGLNLIGLKRRGFTPDDIQQLKRAYRIIYRQGLTWEQVLETLRTTFQSGPAAAFYPFLQAGQRGFVIERRTPAAAVVPLDAIRVDPETADRERVSAEGRLSSSCLAALWRSD